MSRPTRRRPFPVEELARVAGVSLGLHGARSFAEGDSTGLLALAERLDVSARYLRTLRNTGMTWEQADRFAIALGYHPAELWPAWWDEADADGKPEEVAA